MWPVNVTWYTAFKRILSDVTLLSKERCTLARATCYTGQVKLKVWKEFASTLFSTQAEANSSFILQTSQCCLWRIADNNNLIYSCQKSFKENLLEKLCKCKHFQTTKLNAISWSARWQNITAVIGHIWQWVDTDDDHVQRTAKDASTQNLLSRPIDSEIRFIRMYHNFVTISGELKQISFSRDEHFKVNLWLSLFAETSTFLYSGAQTKSKDFLISPQCLFKIRISCCGV